MTFSLHCICGLDRWISPDSTGSCYYEHPVAACGWRVKLVLEEFPLDSKRVRE